MEYHKIQYRMLKIKNINKYGNKQKLLWRYDRGNEKN